MSDHIQINGNVDLQSNDVDNLNNINGETGVQLNIAPAVGEVINASTKVLGIMSGSNTAQLATQAYVDSNSAAAVTSYPTDVGNLQLGVPGSPLTAGSSYTYTINLTGTFVEVAITNFGWVSQNAASQNEPGISFGRAALTQEPRGGVLIANATSGGFHRGFVMNYPEFQDGSATAVTQLFFASSSQISKPLGYGTLSKQTPLDNIQLETLPPGKLEISNVYLGTPSSGITPLYVTIKNVDSITFSLIAYFGVQLTYGYLGDARYDAVSSSNMIVASEIVPTTNNYISTDAGSTFTNYPVSNALSGYPNGDFRTSGMCAQQTGGTQSVYMVDADGYVVAGSSPSYTWALTSETGITPSSNLVGTGAGNFSGSYNNTDRPYGLGQPLAISSDASLMLLCACGYNSGGTIYTSTNQGGSFTSSYVGSSSLADWTGDLKYDHVNTAYTKAVSSTTAFAAFNYYGSYPAAGYYVFGVKSPQTSSAVFILQNTSNVYGFYYTVDGVGSDPGLTTLDFSGSPITVHPIAVLSSDTTVQIAIKTAAALNALGGNPFQAVATQDLIWGGGGHPEVVQVTCRDTGTVSHDIIGSSPLHDIDAWNANPTNNSGGDTYTQAIVDESVAFLQQSNWKGQKQVLLKTTNGGSSWTQPMTHPEFVNAASRFQYVSDNGSDIFLAILGYGYGYSGMYSTGLYASDNVLRFNKSTDGGSTWAHASGAWQTITTNILTVGAVSGQQLSLLMPPELPGSVVNACYDYYTTNYLSGGGLLYGNSTEGLIIFLDSAGFPNVSRSADGGSTWSTVNSNSRLSAFSSTSAGIPSQYYPGGNSANDVLLAYVDYGRTQSIATSYLYTGTEITTFTNWPMFAR